MANQGCKVTATDISKDQIYMAQALADKENLEIDFHTCSSEDISFAENSKKDALFYKFPNTIKALQWHSYEVTGLENNNDITVLGSSNSTKYQIFKYKNNAYGIQFHIEIKNNTVRDWGCIPEYKLALEKSLGLGALEKFDYQVNENMVQMNNLATLLYKNFIKII